MYLVHALIVLCIILKKNDRKGVVCMTNFTVDVSQIVLFIGVMAFIVSIMSEIQVYGSTVLSSSFYDTGCDNIQFPLFRLAPNLKVAGLGHNGSRWWYWLSAVVSAGAFAYCNYDGNSNFSDAAGDGGVRPYFCIG